MNVTVHKRGDQGTAKPWRVRWKGPTGNWHSRSFATKDLADAFRRKVELEAAAGVEITAGATLVRVWWAEWSSLQRWSATTRTTTASRMSHVLERFGERRLSTIRRGEIQAWVNDLAERYAPATVDAVGVAFASLLKGAVDDRLIASSPYSRIVLPEQPESTVEPLSLARVERLAEAMPPRWAAAIWVGALAGLRVGEVAGLTVDRVRFLERRIVVDRQLTTPPGAGVPTFGPTKTRRERVVPLSGPLADVLALHLATYPPGEAGLIFTTEKGGALRRQRLSEAVATARTVLGDDDPAFDWSAVKFHHLRHSMVSEMLDGGIPVNVVSGIVGHKSVATTWDIYGHLIDGAEDRAREAIDAAWARHEASTE